MQALGHFIGGTLLLPGTLVASLTSLRAGTDHYQILRMFLNTVLWTAAGVFVVALNA